MGGYGSGRRAARPTVEDSLTIDVGLALRRGWLRPRATGTGSLSWTQNSDPYASIGYSYDLIHSEGAWLVLTFAVSRDGGQRVSVNQRIALVYTQPTYGGRRWWMICPLTGRRVAKLYLPPGGDRFASRTFWGLSYRSQRSSHCYRPVRTTSWVCQWSRHHRSSKW